MPRVPLIRRLQLPHDFQINPLIERITQGGGNPPFFDAMDHVNTACQTVTSDIVTSDIVFD